MVQATPTRLRLHHEDKHRLEAYATFQLKLDKHRLEAYATFQPSLRGLATIPVLVGRPLSCGRWCWHSRLLSQ